MKGEIRAIAHAPQHAPARNGGIHGNDDERIRYAVANKCLLKFTLHGLDRIAEPHDYGIRKGAPQLLVYQVGGQSRSGKLPAWRWVVLGHASNFEVLEQTFPGSRNAEARNHASWDRIFARVE